MTSPDTSSQRATAANREVYDREPETYSDLSLMPPERAVLARLWDRWAETAMLDLGIGTGRTTYTFAALTRDYVGVDYSPAMVDRARALIGERPGVELRVGDARDLGDLGGPFDFVLFSYNGIDSVGHDDRLAILAEARRVVAPGGHFLMSAHSQGALPLAPSSPNRSWRSLRGLYHRLQLVRIGRRMRRINATLDLAAARERGWTIVQDPAHDFQLRLYYVAPETQVEQLRDAGFEVVEIYDMDGREIDITEAGRNVWLHYLCRPVAAS